MVTEPSRLNVMSVFRLLLITSLMILVAWVMFGTMPATGASWDTPAAGPDGDPIGDPPVILSVAISSPVNENDTATLSGTFSDPNSNDTFTLTVQWGDGTSTIYNYPAGTTAFNETHQYLDDNPTGTSSDQNTVELNLVDSSGLADTETAPVTVNNLAPTLANVAVNSAINENGQATLSGDITDPGSADTFSLQVNWGDGSSQTFNYPAGTTDFIETHQYLDDNPTGTSADVYNLSLTLTDDDTGSGSGSTSLTVNNVAPVVAAGPDQQVDVHALVSFSGSFTDPGSLDTHTIEWDFGDGTPLVSGSLTPTHSYIRLGVYLVTLTVSDDDNGVSSDTLAVTVDGFLNQLPVLFRLYAP